MTRLSTSFLCLALALGAVAAQGVSSSTTTTTSSAATPSPTLPYASDDPNYPMWNNYTETTPEAERGTLGTTVIGGTSDLQLDIQNPDLLAPPTTDAGTVSNAKWPFSLSHNRLQTGGWARQENINVMPIATEMAGVNMRLEVGAIRELHWHKTGEWAYILSGSVQVSAVNAAGQNYLATVSAGDLWYFPAGIPHSLQATADNPNGAEFLLVFDSGSFSEDSTFLLTDWLAHTPKEVIAKNFGTPISAFDTIPASQLYIFPSSPPPDDAVAPISPQGTASLPYTYRLSQVNATQLAGGTVKVVDSTTFKVSTTIAVAEVTVEPGAIRELHASLSHSWHPTQDEWTYFISGNARMTLFAATSNARTYDYMVHAHLSLSGYIPASYGHYVENTGNSTLHFLEIFYTSTYQDISLNQWLALTPPAVVQAHLGISEETVALLTKTKQVVTAPSNPQ
ncbi:hypothetical protein JAAARDRAFT_128142 [Jaapia argillacea MUCL 33604]|uniref:Cupin type-1 domain-containing protein n=1 Tax=Jaapia argillacea MUCL 33604 TaxID=933084 RepID=A0A067Q6P3_9AGAM|nr:hypothetical protein JAAARDRAFT_128142 [Jaapia argillacea MUCL 33604]